MQWLDTTRKTTNEDEEIIIAPSLYKQKIFYWQTRKRGKIFKQVEEKYIRDDLGFGCYFRDDGRNIKKRRALDAVVGKPSHIATEVELISLLRREVDGKGGPLFLIVCDTN